MNTQKNLLLVLILVCLGLSFTAFGGEKGGSGINGEETIILENFELSQLCPEKPAKRLCSKIDEKMNSQMWDIKILTPEEQNESNFFFACCMSGNPSP
jgi:hypothetical protein